MITTVIVEDELPSLERLRLMLEEIPEIKVLSAARTGKEAAALIDSLKPQLIFLDIQLPDLSGLDLLHIITHKPLIVFTTAYNQYAVQAFELKAVDYLLKPFAQDRLNAALQQVKEKINQEAASINEIRSLLANPRFSKEYLTRIPSRIGDRIYILTDDDIIYLASEERIVSAYLYDTGFMINYTLDELQTRLNPDKFFRIHRSTIANLNYISMLEAWFAGGYKTKMKDKKGTELIISRTSGKLLRQKLGW